jgi:histidine ammonia-lyase
LKSGAGTHAAYERARERIAPWTVDRVPAPDIAAARELIASGALVEAAQGAIGEPL